MVQAVQDILFFCSSWVIVLPAILGIIRFKGLPVAARVLCIHLVIACAIEITSSVMSHYRIPNLPLLHVYTLTEFVLIYLFYEVYFNRFYPLIPLRMIAVSFVAFSVFNSLFIQHIDQFNTYARAVESFIIVLLSLLCFYKLANFRSSGSAILLINTGLLLYFSGSFVLFVLSNYLLAYSESLNFHIWAVHASLSLLLYSLITVALWKVQRR